MPVLEYPIRPGAVLLMPSGERAGVAELRPGSVLLRYMASWELVELSREVAGRLPHCGHLPREQTVLLAPVPLDDAPMSMPDLGERLRWMERVGATG